MASVDIANFRALIARKGFVRLRQILHHLEPSDIAEVVYELKEDREFTITFRLIRRSYRPLVFAALPKGTQEHLLEVFPKALVSTFVEAMSPDDRTKLLEDLDPNVARLLVTGISADKREITRMLLSYSPDSVGRLMTTDYVDAQEELDVTAVLARVRVKAKGIDDKQVLNNILVVDAQQFYIGRVALIDIVSQNPTTTKLKEMVAADYVVLNADDDRETAVDMFRKYDRDFLPVVNSKKKLCGIVTADDVLDVAEEEATEDMLQFGGQQTLEDSYFATPVMTLIRKRSWWLALLFIGEIFTGTALRYYDDVVRQLGFLIYFIPLVISTGGNSGTQAAALIIRGIAINEMRLRDWYKVFRREFAISACLGLLLGALGFIRAMTWDYSWTIGLAIATTIASVVMFGALLGSMLPFLFKRLNLDPAVVSSPFIASLVDLFGIVALINISALLLHA